MIINLLSKVDDDYVFETEQLAILLKPYENHKIAVISIAGAFRTGKSFLANWLIRYFEMDRADDWMEVEDKLEEELKGFEFKRQRDPVTDGIDVWADVFEMEHPHHGAVALLLLDTQGIFSMGADFSESVGVFAVSLFLSSLQIYNIRGNMTRSDLEHLRLFASYGKLLTDQNSTVSCVPFQRLVFAIRDWDLDDDIGLEAGRIFLKAIMDEMQDSEEGAELINSIRTSFEKIDCFIMRRPGDGIRNDDFNGQLVHLDDEFKSNLKEFIPFVANDETDASCKCPNLKMDPLKQVLTVDDFMEQIAVIKEIYESGSIGKPESMYGAFSKVSHTKAIKEATKYWNGKLENLTPTMPESRRDKPLRTDFVKAADLEEKFDKYCKKTWSIWDAQPKLSNPESEQTLKKGLEDKMQLDMENTRSENLNREALYDKTWAARFACLIGSCACCLGAKFC